MKPSTIAFTIVSGNYLHFARTLMESVGVAHPDWRRFVLLVDARPQELDAAREPFELVEIADLPLPDRVKFCFRYSILELNTAVKPWMFEWLFGERSADRVVYLDPDIRVYRPLAEVEAALAAGAMMVLTPHLTGQLDDGHHPNEIDILKAGTYNLGFLALARQPSPLEFLAWWQSKLEFNCVVDQANCMFVDQKWLDLVPGMFGNVAILRHDGYNVAYWNLAHRSVVKGGNEHLVNGVPLVFFHFSGLDPKKPETLSRHQDRFDLGSLGAVRDLVAGYVERLRINGADAASRYRYAFGYFTNGEPIPDCIRQLYRQDEEYRRIAGENPFVLNVQYLNRPVPGGDGGACPITVLMHHVWSVRPDVQAVYRHPLSGDRLRFAEWFVASGARDHHVPGACVAPVAEALGRTGAHQPPEKTRAATQDAEARSIDELLKLNDGEFVRHAYHTVLGRTPDAHGFQHFLGELRGGASKVEVLWRLRYSSEGRRKRKRLDGLLLRYAGTRLRRLVVPRARPETATDAVPASAAAVAPTPGKAPVSSPMVRSGEPWAAIARSRFGRSDYIGFHDGGGEQGGLAWMGKSASLRLRNYRAGPLRMTGHYDAEHHQKANGRPATRVDVALNDRLVGSFTLERSGIFDITIRPPADPLEPPIFLTLTSAQTFVPVTIGLNADPRELSIRIARIDADGNCVLDFARDQLPYAAAETTPASPAMNIVGYVRSEMGIGESARLCAGSASAADLPFVLCDFNAGNLARAEDRSWCSRIATDNPHPVNVFHVNADQMPLAHEALGHAFFHQRYNIGFWHWELPDFPDRFKSGFAFLDEIWVPSHFVMDAVSAKAPVPVVRMPHAIEFSVDANTRRQKFGLPDGAFLFLTMYDMNSVQGRKNPHAVIAAYRKAFPDPQAVGLVVKVQNTHLHPGDFEDLERELSGIPGVFLIDRTLSRDEVYELEMLCDCFVSLHRSEGFGLGLAESMFLGKVVIGTNWSGNVDFMNARNSCPVDYRLITLDRDHGAYYGKGNTWADPDVEHAAWYMAKVVADRSWSRRIAAEGRMTIRREFSRERIGRLYDARLRVIAQMTSCT